MYFPGILRYRERQLCPLVQDLLSLVEDKLLLRNFKKQNFERKKEKSSISKNTKSEKNILLLKDT